MTSRDRSLDSPAVTVSLGVFLVSLVLLALASGLLGGPRATPAGSLTAGASGSAEATASPGPSLVPTLGYPTPSPEPTFTAYVVRVGDTLNSIATAYRTTARSIAWWNRGTYPGLDPESPAYAPNDIRPGWVLVLLPGMTVDDENPPSPSPPPPAATADTTATPGATASPRATTRPSASTSPSPSSPPVAMANVLSHGSRTSGQIALTFDMGGRVTPAVDIVTWLIDHGVHATIFPTGATASTSEGHAVLALVQARPDLFDLGNHSWDHPYFTTLTAAQMAQQLTSTETAVAPLAGLSTKPWFRPPYGAWNTAVREGVRAAGWRHIITWDVDTIDWKQEADGGPTIDDIVAKVTTKAQGGSIVLMHLGGYHTLEALPGILAAIQAKGLLPVTLGEMFNQ